jgi:hypothetical protein
MQRVVQGRSDSAARTNGRASRDNPGQSRHGVETLDARAVTHTEKWASEVFGLPLQMF